MLFALAAASFSYGLITAIRSELDALDPSKARGDIDTVVYSAPNRFGERRVLAILRGDESRVLVASKDISPIMKQAIVAVEDKRFYEHNGVDVRGIVRALWQDIRSQSVVEGGSTITQQYVKNAYSRNEQTIGRKVREAALAWQLTQRWSKDRILPWSKSWSSTYERRSRAPTGCCTGSYRVGLAGMPARSAASGSVSSAALLPWK